MMKTTLILNLISLYPKDLSQFNSKWVHYTRNPKIKSHYNIVLSLKNIVLSPELIKETEYTETKNIRDGWEYILNENENVIKDSLGNDIKKPKYIIISCLVKKTIQRRDVNIFAELNYYDNKTKEIIKNVPLKSHFFIENIFAVANGDYRALKPKTKELLRNNPILMPPDIDMIYQAGKPLNEVVKQNMISNKRIIK